jgi:hypothetical protein
MPSTAMPSGSLGGADVIVGGVVVAGELDAGGGVALDSSPPQRLAHVPAPMAITARVSLLTWQSRPPEVSSSVEIRWKQLVRRVPATGDRTRAY